MNIYETTIKNPKKIAEFYKQLSEQKDIEIEQLKKQLQQRDNIIKDVSDYINFLVIIDTRLAGGRFKDTIWGKELLEILNIDKGE